MEKDCFKGVLTGVFRSSDRRAPSTGKFHVRRKKRKKRGTPCWVCPASAFVTRVVLSLHSVDRNDRNLDPLLAHRHEHLRRRARIGDHMVDVAQPADPAEAPPAELRGVGQHHGLRGRGDHRPVQTRLLQVRGREPYSGSMPSTPRKSLLQAKLSSIRTAYSLTTEADEWRMTPPS